MRVLGLRYPRGISRRKGEGGGGSRAPHPVLARPGGGATWGCGPLGVLLRLLFGVLEPPGENKHFDVSFVQFREYFLNNCS